MGVGVGVGVVSGTGVGSGTGVEMRVRVRVGMGVGTGVGEGLLLRLLTKSTALMCLVWAATPSRPTDRLRVQRSATVPRAAIVNDRSCSFLV